MLLNKKTRRVRRSRQTRIRISLKCATRLTVHRTNQHIYATIVSSDGSKILAAASTSEAEVRQLLAGEARSPSLVGGGNTAAAIVVGQRIAQKARAAGIESVAFDRAGFAYHGRVKALAEAARAAGLKF
jgi:large subunit ribosomal protein L18